MDRLESTRATSRVAPRPPEVRPEAPKSSETTRVGTQVVRRRVGAAPEPAPPPPPAAPPPRTVIRRPAATLPADPSARPSMLRGAAEGAPGASALRIPGPPGLVERPTVSRPPAEPVAAAVPVADPVEPARAVPEPAPVEVAAIDSAPPPVEAAVTQAEAGTAPAPSVPPEAPPPDEPGPPPEPTPERAVIVERPGGPTRPATAPGLRSPAERRLNQTPILPGLGLGVVSLPAGYDPTDPTGARRRAREQAGAGNRWGPAAPTGDRRPAGGAPEAERRRRDGRGGRSELLMTEIDGGRYRKPKAKKSSGPQQPVQRVKRKVRVDGEITVANLAHELGEKASELIRILMQMGQTATVNQRIDFDTASFLAGELGHELVNVAFDEAAHLIQSRDDGAAGLAERPPVVTVMGHVDHGKTTLLDTIRRAKVAEREAGGITQHIGAYQVRRGDKPITFLDTPGHAAFSAMRARGGKAADIVVLVVAADDGVMPQTVEAINHAKAAGVPIVVAVNKVDKPGVNPEAIRRGLMQHGMVPEEFGGDTIFVNVSALKGTGVDDLLDAILLVAEVQSYRANPDRHAEGVVLESRLEVGRGAVATLLVKTGTLKQGDIVVIGTTWGRVRAMSDDTGTRIKEAGPSTPVEIFGLQDLPLAGDEVVVVGSEKDARTLSEHRMEVLRVGSVSERTKLTVDDLYKTGEVTAEQFLVVLKTDVGGSLEALRGAIEAIAVTGTAIKILHSGVGPVTESDVNLAAANGALVVAFNVKADANARKSADQHKVEIKRYDVIYQVLDDIKARMLGLLAPVYELQRTGVAEVRAVFNITKFGPIAGCMIVEGKVNRGSQAKVMREAKVAHEGKLSGLKRFKEDVREVVEGFECGIAVEGYADIAVGDRIEVFVQVEVPRGS